VRAIIALLLFISPIAAQKDLPPELRAPAPRHLSLATSAGASSGAPGSKLSLFVDIVPKPGIHVYAPGAKNYRAIGWTLGPTSGVTVGKIAYPASELLFFAPLKETVPVYQRPFRLTRDITISSSTKRSETLGLSGTIEYQACDDKVCFVPESVAVRWSITVR